MAAPKQVFLGFEVVRNAEHCYVLSPNGQADLAFLFWKRTKPPTLHVASYNPARWKEFVTVGASTAIVDASSAA